MFDPKSRTELASGRETATLREIDRGLGEAGHEVLAVAPTRSAVDELEKVGFRDAMTVSRLLEAQEPQGALRGKILIVDEAGIVSGRQMQSLLHLAEDQGARIVFSGNTRQIPSVEASDALRISERESGLKSISLTEVQRQTNSLYREAVKTMRHSPEEGFEQLEKLGAIRDVSIFDRGQIVAELHREFRAEVRDTLVIAGKRDAQSRVVSLLLDKNEEKPSTEAYRTVTDLQNSGRDLQVVDKVWRPQPRSFELGRAATQLPASLQSTGGLVILA